MSRNFTTGSRRDSADNKAPLAKLMWTALKEVAKVHKYGDDHYGYGNWRKGQPYSEVYNSALRHLGAFFHDGETVDESSQHHLAHAAWNVLFLLHMDLHADYYGKSCDDRLDDFGTWRNTKFAATDWAKKLETGEAQTKEDAAKVVIKWNEDMARIAEFMDHGI